MAKVKGSAEDTMRKILKKQPQEIQEKYLASLSPEARDTFEHAMAVSWRELDTNEETNSVALLARTLYPNDPLALQKLAYTMAKDSMPRFYQIFIRIPTVEYVVKRVAKIWSSFYERGEALIENFKDQHFTMVLKQYPDYPPFLREYMCGYLKGVGDLLHLKNVAVQKIETDPEAWKWEVTWEK